MTGDLVSKDKLLMFAIITTWELIWKGIALWRSARKNHLIIFVLLILFNTIGVFPILYLLYLRYENVFEPYISKFSYSISNFIRRNKKQSSVSKGTRTKYKKIK